MIVADVVSLWVSIGFGGALVALAGVLMWIHETRQSDGGSGRGSEPETEYFLRRYRRRRRLNWLIAITGLAVILSPLITLPLLRAAYWAIVVLIACWIMLLAVLDWMASYFFLQSLRTRQRAARMAMETHYRQLRQQTRGHDSSANSNVASDKAPSQLGATEDGAEPDAGSDS